MEEGNIIQASDSIIDDLAADGLQVFQRAIEKAGLVLSSELLNEWSSVVSKSDDLLAVEWQFNMYGRFKDMKSLRYTQMPPIEAFEKFVEKVGVDKFAWVPGYDSKQSVPTEIAINRIAWGIAKHRMAVPVVKRSGPGWYNENVMKLVNKARYMIRQKTAEWVSQKTIKVLEEEG